MRRGAEGQQPADTVPTSDAAHGANVGRVGGIETGNNTDCPATPHARQALQAIEGERKAAQYVAKLQAQQADPDELALIVSMMYGAALRGFCRVLAKALGVRHG